ncbi:substrate-binding periplasmic protein [Roseateles sp. DXS20W]|uniref:Substrate-binding periplasmic protein n=1 Tax=Pelomonas lactea TaxID=3299030 RepID=A0ABW7GSD8_9BURK
MTFDRPATPRPRPPARWLLALTLALALAAPPAARAADERDRPLRYVVPTNQAMPLLAMQGQQPVDGLLKDIAQALATRLGRPLQYVVLPSKRAASALKRGEADVHCYVQPGWLEGELLWTQRFITSAEVVAAAHGAPAIESLDALAGEPLGTVLGYRYATPERVLGERIVRRDVVDAETNLRRLALGRVRYALTDRLSLQHFVKRHPPTGLREVLEFDRTELGCAVSPREAGALDAINQALRSMRNEGRLDQILDRYR